MAESQPRKIVTPQASPPVEGEAARRMSRTEMVASILSVMWLVAVAAYILVAPEGVGTLGLVMTLMMVFLPIAVIWVAVTTLRSVQELRTEAARLQSTVENMRATWVQSQVQPSVEKKLDEIERSTRSTETTLATFTSRRDVTLTQASARNSCTERSVVTATQITAMGKNTIIRVITRPSVPTPSGATRI